MDNYNSDILELERRKRINRFKKMIVVTCLILIVIPIIMCILLLLRVNHLENRIDQLIDLAQAGEITAQMEPNGEDFKFVYTKSTPNITDNKQTQSGNTIEELPSDEELMTEDSTTKEDEETETFTEEQTTAPYNTESKRAFLTFDDGPSDNTDKILDILDEYDIKATFFVIGKTGEDSLKAYREIVDRGHTLGLHTYSHQYKYIYDSVDNFAEDLGKLRKLLKDTVGKDITLFRFPGGSSTTTTTIPITELIKYANTNGYVYFDWNVSSQDAVSGNTTPADIVYNVMKDAVSKTNAVILMHDANGKDATVEALPEIISQLKEAGYEFCAIDDTATPVQHIKADSVE